MSALFFEKPHFKGLKDCSTAVVTIWLETDKKHRIIIGGESCTSQVLDSRMIEHRPTIVTKRETHI
jgi:hypothetical protein